MLQSKHSFSGEESKLNEKKVLVSFYVKSEKTKEFLKNVQVPDTLFCFVSFSAFVFQYFLIAGFLSPTMTKPIISKKLFSESS